MSRAIGIDLGTTFTCVAYMKTNDAVEVASNEHGNKITPSVVHFGSNLTKIGEDAVAMRGADAKNTIYQIKRFMGRAASDAEIKKRNYPFEIIGSENGTANIRVTPLGGSQSKSFCPEQISGDILRYAKKIAEESLGKPVREAVITVPANFTNAQKEATKAAGEIAGLQVLRILNEPTAAALAYGFDRRNNHDKRTVLVYDLGGGTFDVSIVELRGTEADVKSTRGLTFLGGEDFDNRLYEEAVASFRQIGSSIARDGQFALLQSCEQAKRTLSTCDTAEISGYDSRGERKCFMITRESFEELCNDLFEKTIDCVKDAMRESGCTMTAIDDVVLVGGSSRIPRVQLLLQRMFPGKRLKFDLQPDQAVAQGAAILANSLSRANSGGAPMRKIPGSSSSSASSSSSSADQSGGVFIRLSDVTPLTLGVGLVHDRMNVLIRRNTRYPTTATTMVYNVESVNEIEFPIFEGESAVSSKNSMIGTLTIAVPMKPPSENRMKVTFTIDANGLLNMQVVDTDTGEQAQITVETSALSSSQRQKMAREANTRADFEREQQKKLEARTTFADAVRRAKTAAGRVPDERRKEEIEALVRREERWMVDARDPSNDQLYEHAKSIRMALSRMSL